MSYTRQPNVVLAGRALLQNPPASTTSPPGIVPVQLDADIATTTSLGVVQVGSGLAITPLGVLTATGSFSGLYSVKLVESNYTATSTDFYIGAKEKDITITLPLGVLGKIYTIKNQANGNIAIKPTVPQKIDGSSSQSLSTGKSIIVIFNGTQWETISTI